MKTTKKEIEISCWHDWNEMLWYKSCHRNNDN